MIRKWISLLFATILCILVGGVTHAQDITVVNMIPLDWSGETNQDSEPNLAINPANPLQIAGSAFTPGAGFCAANLAPIYVSTDGGNTWGFNCKVPSDASAMTSDITVRFGGTSGNLYAGILRRPGGLRLNILRTPNFAGGGTMTVLVDRYSVDQPYIQAATVMGGAGTGNDRVYVGDNDFGAPAARTATIDQSPDSTITTPTFNSIRIESRTTSGQDGPPIRPAIHPDGTVYAIFYGWRAFTGTAATTDVVVVRDDNWGTGATPFTALTDPGDALAGMRVVTGRTVPWANVNQPAFGQERFVGSNISIAVDPRNSSTVYIAWADRVGASDYTLHVRRSLNRGVTWSGDLRTVTNATNPTLAINSLGEVGFLYQLLTGTGATQRWVTHLERTANAFATIDDQILANVPANTPVWQFRPYIGDYIHLMAGGKNFYGIFSANNTPDNANFPNGVTYQRNANFTTNTLLDTDNTTPVAVSIDPFFVRVLELPPESDFYVRDWTSSPTNRDTGLEPSTNPVFYINSDVWNRRSNAPGGFNANDQPQSQDPQMISLGDNFAFARVARNASGTAEVVTAHFLVSEFGTGSNYQHAGPAADPTISFAATDLEQTMASGFQWQLPVTTSSHTCLAVEISTPNDPIVAPSLLGRAPGWPTTDLMVINDNNKAQRNMGVYSTGGSGQVSFYAVIHNAATFPRDMELELDVLPEIQGRLGEAYIEVIGGERFSMESGGTIRLPEMQPGENRWIGLTYESPRGEEGELLPVMFHELVDGRPVNGFAIAARPSPLDRVFRENLELHAQSFMRMAASFEIDTAMEESEAALELLATEEISDKAYSEYLKSHLDLISDSTQILLSLGEKGDPFEIEPSLEHLGRMLASDDIAFAVTAHMTLIHKLDAFVTMLQKAEGDPADILQNVRWQIELFAELPQLQTERILEMSRQFASGYEVGEVSNGDYPDLIASLLEDYRAAAEILAAQELMPDIDAMEVSLDSLAALQKSHRDFLLKLQRVVIEKSEIKDMMRQSKFVFAGTVQELEAATMAMVQDTEKTAIVTVDEIFEAPEMLRNFVGRAITVQLLEPGSVEVGQQAVFFTNGWLLGDSIAVLEVGRLPIEDTSSMRSQIEEAVQQLADEELQERIARAEVVVVGKVSAVREAAELVQAQPVTEHDPEWRVAVIDVEEVLKGEWSEPVVEVLFSSSTDVMWYQTPKLREGQEAVLFLDRIQITETGFDIDGFAAIDSLTVWPRSELDRIRELVERLR